ncbi:MAG: DNA recombination protein RmuC [Henriciella sp.]|nr:DNA recombination protein RmuC [Henriciella sp.]
MDPLIQIGDIGLDLIHLIAVGISLILAGGLYHLMSKRSLAEEAQRDTEADLAHTLQQLETQRARAEDARLELAELKGQSAKDKEQFGEIARGVMAQAQKHFMDLANETFEKHKAGARGDLQKLMEPIGQNFDEFKKRVERIEKVRAEDKSAIQQQVRAIGESLHRNTAETGKLVNALTAPKGGGRWGEMTLRNVMEQAGLSAHCDFDEQVNDQTENGMQRPDAVIHLPGGRQIVVDSKVSLEAYMAAAAAEDQNQRAVHLKAHATNVQRHVETLSRKAYQDNLDERVDFVAMFIPGENFFAAALEHAPDLLERAYSKNVIVTTPSTLIGLAKTVSYVWRQEKMTENAREAAKLGEQLYERIATMAGHIEKLGKSLNGAVDHYNKMNSSLDKRVMPTMRKFEQLAIAPPDKSMPEPKKIEASADVSDRAPELDFAK